MTEAEKVRALVEIVQRTEKRSFELDDLLAELGRIGNRMEYLSKRRLKLLAEQEADYILLESLK